MRMTSNPSIGINATDFYANFSSGYGELYFRWYVKYQAGIPWHHAGVWFGGYNPPLNWANPQAGTKPAGNDRFSIAIEPAWTQGSPNPPFDFYNYWMNMHTCSSCGGSYFGNNLISKSTFTAEDNQWECVEVHAKLNTDMSSATGSILEVWRNDSLMESLTPTSSTNSDGKWVQDHYCPADADMSRCTSYSATAPQPVNLQVRTTTALNLNYFWPQNYITSGGAGSMRLSNMVVATKRIGCIAP